jgi:hypothetical protein
MYIFVLLLLLLLTHRQLNYARKHLLMLQSCSLNMEVKTYTMLPLPLTCCNLFGAKVERDTYS